MIIGLSTLNFIRGLDEVYHYINSNYVYQLDDVIDSKLKTDNVVELVFDEDSVKIVDSYRLSYDERFEVLSFIKSYLNVKGIKNCRTIQNYEGELYFHSLSYNLGFIKESSKDADLEYQSDSRWYVRYASIVLQILGL